MSDALARPPLWPMLAGAPHGASAADLASGQRGGEPRRAVALRRRTRSSPHLSLGQAERLAELNEASFVKVCELGTGFGGIVYKALRVPDGKVVAIKVVNSRISPGSLRTSLASELGALQRCSSPYVVELYGASIGEMHISLALEYMDVGSLDAVCRLCGPIPEGILEGVAQAITRGLLYLHDEHNIMHRDLKPSNVLLNSAGQVKLCDFGESIQLVNFIAKSLVGTTGYMAPERIQGHEYTPRSDVWSLGITLVELATGRFPYNVPLEERRQMRPMAPGEDGSHGEDGQLALIELWEAISTDPSAGLCPSHFSAHLVDFVQCCLEKNEAKRPDASQLLMHPFLALAKCTETDLRLWAQSIAKSRP